MTIRKYTPSDKEALITLLRLNTPEYFAETEEKDFLNYLENHSENHFVVTSEHVIAGCGGFNLSDDLTTGKISWDIIHPFYQHNGIGSQLVNFRIEKMLQIKTIKCLSVRTSQHAFRFYEKFGFILKEKITGYWARDFDLYHMEMQINNKS